ncbi:hypothetical protein J4230_05040 [Candidatus Woesearchaeota archaeon]|nr:hypothetical protein [Candidatus Woesearchaeota archaeon]
MQGELVKPTKRNKCDYCDELATYKVKKQEEPTLYLCPACFKENKLDKK